MKTYVCDIDGTICESKDGDYKKSTPIQSRIKKINELYNAGHTIIFHTARGMGRFSNAQAMAHAAFYDLTIKQLALWGVKYHSLFMGKPSGDCYIDDKGISDEDFFNSGD
jgi:capsule biosynthesis phosphatase